MKMGHIFNILSKEKLLFNRLNTQNAIKNPKMSNEVFPLNSSFPHIPLRSTLATPVHPQTSSVQNSLLLNTSSFSGSCLQTTN